MEFYWLVLGLFSVWRITHLLNAEDGPWDLLARLRRVARSLHLGKLLDCFYCLSLWIAVPFSFWLGSTWGERSLLWLSLSTGAILLERLTNHETTEVPPAQYKEDKE